MSRPASSIACSSGVPSAAWIARPSTVTRTIFGLLKFPPAAMDFGPGLAGAFVLDAGLELDEAVEDRLWTRWASRDVKMDRNNPINPLKNRVIVIRTAGTGARAERNHPLRLGHLVIDPAQDRRDAMCDGADYEQQVGLARSEARQRRAEAIDVPSRPRNGKILHPAARGDEGIRKEGILTRPLDRVGEPGSDEAFRERAALIGNRRAGQRSADKVSIDFAALLHLSKSRAGAGCAPEVADAGSPAG